MERQGILVVDFGGQYNLLIARRVREANVYCEVVPYFACMEAIKAQKPQGIIFTGGPNSVYGEGAPSLPKELFQMGIPMLGICYGAQLMAHALGGEVARPDTKEYGRVSLHITEPGILFDGIEQETECWMSHTDYIANTPEGFITIAHTDSCPTAAMANAEQKLYGVQFHPEVMHTPFGTKMIQNFLYHVCGCGQDWTMSQFAQQKIAEIKETVGDKKVLCALSGGVDSSVAAVLVHKAIGDRLTCIFVDHGLLRKDEGDQVEEVYGRTFNLNLIRVNAQERFLSKLAGVSDPETKRKIIGNEFINVFDEEAEKIGAVDFLLQGTIYPDVVESGTGQAAVIKSHHNVGGLPEDMQMQLLEPLRQLFKDEVRGVGEALGIPHDLVWRQPFPGPGLAIRCLGDITEEKLQILRESDAILREEVKKNGLESEIWQYFTVLPNISSVGVMGDERTYCHTVGIRAVTSVDGMTSDWARMPYDVLDLISRRIVNEVPGVNRIVYDVTSKPPSTIEWE